VRAGTRYPLGTTASGRVFSRLRNRAAHQSATAEPRGSRAFSATRSRRASQANSQARV
jgi:DNA-binding IclR family transcriptional regulator